MSQILSTMCFCMSRQSAIDGTREVVAIVPCGHVVHKACMNEWWQKNRGRETCPSCATRIHISPKNPGFVRLFGIKHHDPSPPGSAQGRSGEEGRGAPSSDALTQETQQVVENLARRRRRRANVPRNGKMVVPDDEDEHDEDEAEDGGEGDEHALRQALIEVEGYKKHALDLEQSLNRLETSNEELRFEIEGLQEQIGEMNADVIEDLQQLNEALEQDTRRMSKDIRELTYKLDKARTAARERKERIEVLERKLGNEGDEGSKKIQTLEDTIDSLQRDLMHARGARDKLEDDVAQVKAQAEQRMDQIKEEAKRRVNKAEMLEEEARNNLEKERDVTAKARSGNKSWESRYTKLQRKYRELQRKKGKAILESDSDDDLDRYDAEPDPPAAVGDTKTMITLRAADPSARLPLAALSSHNYYSSSPPAPAYKIKNRSTLISPVKSSPDRLAARGDDDEGNLSASVRRDDLVEDEHEKEAAHGDGGDSSSEIEIIEPTPSRETVEFEGRLRSKRDQLDFALRPRAIDDEVVERGTGPLERGGGRHGPGTIASKYFAATTSSGRPQVTGAEGPPFGRDGAASTCLNRGGGPEKRPFERTRSDKHLPDFGREGVAVHTGPKRKIRRQV